MLVDVPSRHDGAEIVGGEALVAVVIKMRNQWVIEYHGIVAKLKQDSVGAEAHRGALATVRRTRWRCCRPRGRRARTAVSRRNQAKLVGWLGA